MKYFCTLLCLFLLHFQSVVKAKEWRITGMYKGENLMVYNPSVTADVFCISEVYVNGVKSQDPIKSNSFEIDLSVYDLKPGDKVVIIFKQEKSCSPQILNMDAIQPISTYKVKSIELTEDEFLTWVTTDETDILPFYVEQYRWNKWVVVDTIRGKGHPDASYSVKVNFHGGKNIFRVKQIDHTLKPQLSQEVIFRSLKPEITYENSRNEIIFSDITFYELFNERGEIIRIGSNKKIDISGLSIGTYYLNYDNKMSVIKKRF